MKTVTITKWPGEEKKTFEISDEKHKNLIDFIDDMRRRKKERMDDRFPPKEIIEVVNKKTEDTYTLNNGNLDKESFRLGMYCMWDYLKSKTDE